MEFKSAFNMTETTNKLDRHLGQKSEYIDKYDSSLLVRELRQNNRKYLKLDPNNLPFVGVDTWNAYEFSTLTANGLPVVGVVKLVYPCTSPYIVESKSLKLYLGSFANQVSTSNDPDTILDHSAVTIAADLSLLLETTVRVHIAPNKQLNDGYFSSDEEWMHVYAADYDDSYITIEDEYPVSGAEFTKFNESPELLQVCEPGPSIVRYHSSLLRSRCRVSEQPDTGDIFIEIHDSKRSVDPISLLQYIVSFRNECHFHEEICEAVYTRLWNIVKPEKLAVRCLYARRGGIDINPERVSHHELSHYSLAVETYPHVKLPRQ